MGPKGWIWALLAALIAAAGCGGRDQGACPQMLECMGAIDPGGLSGLKATYGDEGDCWTEGGEAAASCRDACEIAVGELATLHPWEAACAGDVDLPDLGGPPRELTDEERAECRTGGLHGRERLVIDLRMAHGDVAGSVEYHHYPNEGSPCQIVWAVDGTVEAPYACPTCQYSLESRYAIALSETNCPRSWYDESGEGPLMYDVAYDEEYDAVFFNRSGEPRYEGKAHAGQAWGVIDWGCYR